MSLCFGPAMGGGTGAVAGSEVETAAQRHLDDVNDAILSDDFDAFLEHVSLPLVTATARGLQRFETHASLEFAFRRVTASWRRLGVTRIDSSVQAVVEDAPGRVLRTHVTRLWKGDALVRPPHSGLSVLALEKGQWRIQRAQHAVGENSGDMGFDATPDADEDHAEVAAAFSDALDRVTQAFLTGDFELLCDCVRKPLFLQNSDGTLVIRDGEGLRADHERILADFRMHEITDLVRLVKRARRLCAGRIQGLYRTHVLSGQLLALPSFQSVMTLEQGNDGVWRTAEIMHPLGPVTLRR